MNRTNKKTPRPERDGCFVRGPWFHPPSIGDKARFSGMNNGHDPAWNSIAFSREGVRVPPCSSKGVDARRYRKELAAKVPLSGPSVTGIGVFLIAVRCGLNTQIIRPGRGCSQAGEYWLARRQGRSGHNAARLPNIPIIVRMTCDSGSEVWMNSWRGDTASNRLTTLLSSSSSSFGS